MQRFLAAFFLVFFLTSAPVLAERASVSSNKKQEIGDLQKKLEDHKKQKAELEKLAGDIQKELSGTRDNLVTVGKSIQTNERDLQSLESRIVELEKQKTALRDSLKKDRHSMANLILALQRIRRVPPEAMIAKPDAPFRTAQSAMLMGDIIPALYKKAEVLKTNLEHIEEISKDLSDKKEKALAVSKSLDQENQKLSELVEKREKLFSDTHDDLKQQEEDVKRISQQAKNLQDLVQKLDEDRKQQKSRKTASIPEIPLPKAGNAQLPVSGVIRTRYDEPDNFGAPSKGITIEGRSGALVVAPMGGVIRFSGHFKNYGNMVIIEHQKGFHSLIAGLEKIDTVVGQSVSAGEAIGLLPRAGTGEKPSLYYELRLNGQSVNPARKFADLG